MIVACTPTYSVRVYVNDRCVRASHLLQAGTAWRTARC